MLDKGVIIVGQGLAGSALAWQLFRRGQSFHIIDDAQPQAASRVAAGLVTPVTGRALRARPGFLDDLEECRLLYKSADAANGTRCWTERAALRLLDTEQALERARQAHIRCPDLIGPGGTLPSGLRPVSGLASMPPAARLNVAAWLAASAATFAQNNALQRATVGPNDVKVSSDAVSIEKLGLRARHLVWCGGARDAHNGWLPVDALSPARGEMIRVNLPDVRSDRVMHRGGRWLRPLSDGSFQFGATYDHDAPVARTSDAARRRLMDELTRWTVAPPTLLEHTAGVRPVARDRQPFVTAHPVHRRVLAFNGLGSHGVLVAPRLARQLAERLCQNAPIA